MGAEKIVVLDGSPSGVDNLNLLREALIAELKKRSSEVAVVELRDEKLAHCIGCIQCWLKTPGLCRFADRGIEIIESMIRNDTVVLFTPVTF